MPQVTRASVRRLDACTLVEWTDSFIVFTSFDIKHNHYRIGEVRAFSARPIPPRINASSRCAWRWK